MIRTKRSLARREKAEPPPPLKGRGSSRVVKPWWDWQGRWPCVTSASQANSQHTLLVLTRLGRGQNTPERHGLVQILHFQSDVARIFLGKWPGWGEILKPRQMRKGWSNHMFSLERRLNEPMMTMTRLDNRRGSGLVLCYSEANSRINRWKLQESLLQIHSTNKQNLIQRKTIPK